MNVPVPEGRPQPDATPIAERTTWRCATSRPEVVLSLRGAVDSACVQDLQAAVEQAHRSEADLVVCLEQEGSLDSCALAVLVTGSRRARRYGGHVVLYDAPERVLGVLRLTGLARSFVLRGRAGAGDGSA